jgi:putative transposase
MLFRNDIFKHEGQRYRFLHIDVEQSRPWAIALDDFHAWPINIDCGALQRIVAEEVTTPIRTINPSTAMLLKRDEAYARIEPLVTQLSGIYSSVTRGPLVHYRSQELGCSKRTLYKDLRRWFQGGQIPDALLGRYHNSGRTTAIRAARSVAKVVPQHGDENEDRESSYFHSVYILTADDLAIFRKHIERSAGYLKDGRVTMTHDYQRLLEQSYSTIDGNGDKYINTIGRRPTYRQFSYFIRKHYSLEARLRGRKGDKDFELENAANVGTIVADCRGVGHYYEIDATIVDVYLVSATNIRDIIGKPTLYLIIDRKSRLIVGFYCGLENASWMGAMQAILSIATDKRALCNRYGVIYQPEDWPADKVFPREFLADRGEMLSSNSNKVCDGLAITVTNLPSRMAKWKPVVECGFKLTHEALADVAPSYNPVFNAVKRQGKHYDKDACLTLFQFVGIMLRTIVAHNRKAMLRYNSSLDEVSARVQPIPIHLWNHDIPKSAANLIRYAESQVRQALLPKEKATVTDKGLFLRGCFYTCREAEVRGWFVVARNTSQFSLTVSFDYRLVDIIWIHSPNSRDALIEGTLTTRSEKFRGMSFAEVAYHGALEKKMGAASTQNRLQTMLEYHQDVDPVSDAAKRDLKHAGTNMSRSARKDDINAERAEARRQERRELVSSPLSTEAGPLQNAVCRSDKNPNTPEAKRLKLVQIESKSRHSDTPSPAERAQKRRRKMLDEHK